MYPYLKRFYEQCVKNLPIFLYKSKDNKSKTGVSRNHLQLFWSFRVHCSQQLNTYVNFCPNIDVELESSKLKKRSTVIWDSNREIKPSRLVNISVLERQASELYKPLRPYYVAIVKFTEMPI